MMLGQARIYAYRLGPVVLMWCSACGPMGVTEGEIDAKMIHEHLSEHGEGEE